MRVIVCFWLMFLAVNASAAYHGLSWSDQIGAPKPDAYDIRITTKAGEQIVRVKERSYVATVDGRECIGYAVRSVIGSQLSDWTVMQPVRGGTKLEFCK